MWWELRSMAVPLGDSWGSLRGVIVVFLMFLWGAGGELGRDIGSVADLGVQWGVLGSNKGPMEPR